MGVMPAEPVRDTISPLSRAAAIGFNLVAAMPAFQRPPLSTEMAAGRAIRWILHSQDRAQALFAEGGYSRRYSFLKGWDRAYPETTGYLIPTLLNAAERFPDKGPAIRESVAAAGEWLLAVQCPDGSFNDIDERRRQVFDTGQIIFGLIAMHAATKEARYLDAALKAARWIVQVQDGDGAWYRFACHFRPHTYYSRVAWALARVHTVTGDEGCRSAACRNLDWVLAQQHTDGSFSNSGFVPGETVLHTIAYTLQGLVECGVLLKLGRCIEAADRTAEAAIRIWRQKRLRSYYGPNWKPLSASRCLTGLAQLSIVLKRLHQVLGREGYLAVAHDLDSTVRFGQIRMPAAIDIDGAIPGSVPLWGKYCPMSLPNWAAKFFIDSHLLSSELQSGRCLMIHAG